MNRRLERSLKRIFRFFGLGVMSRGTLDDLLESKGSRFDIEFLAALPDPHIAFFLKRIDESRAQRRQDIFVLSELCLKTNGFFVEFGAGNGVDFSNTYMLEKAFGWRGILSEPARPWHAALKENRSCIVETYCVWRESATLVEFTETKNPCFSTIRSFRDKDFQAEARKGGRTYEVETITLADLLASHDAPAEIDCLSIDTEGSEYEILRAFDFDRYHFGVITCGHNYTPQREEIHAPLASKGYQRKFEELSDCDDWYVRRTSETS